MKTAGRYFFCAVLLGAGLGCGDNAPPPTKASDAVFKGTTDDDKTQVAEILKKEGIEGDIIGLIKGDTMWSVDVGKKTVPGKRATPAPPTTYTIEKATGKVTRAM